MREMKCTPLYPKGEEKEHTKKSIYPNWFIDLKSVLENSTFVLAPSLPFFLSIFLETCEGHPNIPTTHDALLFGALD